MSSAAALPKGSPIGPHGTFREGASMVRAVGFFLFPSGNGISGAWRGSVKTFGNCSSHNCYIQGNVADAYLGFQFYLDGQAHYGWVELSLSTFASKGEAGLDGEITAFAYETVVNQGLNAGQRSDTPEPATLGLLALGSLGLGFWRRKTVGSQQ